MAQTNRGRARRRNPALTRARLLSCAMEQFGQRGYAQTTIVDIERAAGLSPGAGGLYRHFASKEELLLIAVRDYRAQIAAVAEELPLAELATPSQALDAIPRLLGPFVAKQLPSLQVFALQGLTFPTAARAEIQGAWEDGYAVIAATLQRLAPDSDLDYQAAAVRIAAELAHYFAHSTAFGDAPAGVGIDRFLRDFVRHWYRTLQPATDLKRAL